MAATPRCGRRRSRITSDCRVWGQSMKILSLAGPVAATALFFCASTIEAGVLVPIPSVPGSTETFARTINDKNIIVGRYLMPDGSSHGFFGPVGGSYQTFDGLDGQTFANGINNAGYITGQSNVPNENCPYYGCQFLRRPSGSIQEITRRGAPFDGIPEQIIFDQHFVGQFTYVDQNENFFIYGYYGRGPRYTARLTLPFDTARTRPRGLAEDGTVTGWFSDFRGSHGFVLRNGSATAYDYPDANAFITEFEGVNANAWVPGAWEDAYGTLSRAFVLNYAKSKFSPIDVSGATYAFAGGVNNSNLVVVNGDTSSFLYCPESKTCPIHSPEERQIQERWIPVGNFSRTLPCKNGCLAPFDTPPAAAHVSPAALRAAMARDPELQREMHRPFRP